MKTYSQEIIEYAYNLIKSEKKDLWRFCKFKSYDPYKPNLYPSIKMMQISMHGAVDKIAQGFEGSADILEYLFVKKSIECGHPTYWVDPGLADALRKTRFPMSFNWVDAQLPINVCTFVLPKDQLVYSDNRIVECISFFRSYIDEQISHPFQKGGTKICDAHNFAVFGFVNDGTVIHFSFTSKFGNEINLSNIHDEMDQTKDKRIETHHSAIHQADLDAEDKVMLEKITHLIFGLIFLMKERSYLVTKAVLKKRVKSKSSDEIKEFWTSPVIGKDYKVRVKYDPKGGTHASPRLHYVPGFFNTFHVGIGRKETISKWIEPHWRGVTE